MSPNTMIVCPVDGCDWRHDATPREVPPETLARVFGTGVMTAVAHQQHLQRTEREVELHMATHKPQDFLRTITRLYGVVDDLSRALAYMESCAR